MKKLLKVMIGIPALIALWLLVAPSSIGGSLSYVITEGDSMAPRIHEGDLIVVKTKPSYEVGDAIAYPNPRVGSVVFHRIVERAGDRYITQGDNNDFLDGYRPRASEVIGAEMLHVPGFGDVLDPLRTPIGISLMSLFGLGLLLFGWIRHHSDDAPVRIRSGLSRIAEHRRKVFAALGVPLGFVSLLTAVAWMKPTTEPVQKTAQYEQTGTFSYSGQARRAATAAYPDRIIRTGQPLFLRLVDDAVVRFDYSIESVEVSDLQGELALNAELIDPTSGWRRPLPFAGTGRLDRSAGAVRAELDVRQLQDAIERVERVTGVDRQLYRLVFTARTDARGEVATTVFEDEMKAQLAFQVDDFQVQILEQQSPVGEPIDPFHITEEGKVSYSTTAPAQVGLLGLGATVPALRTGGLLGIVLFALFMVAAYFLLPRPDEDEAHRIASRFGNFLVPVRPGVSKGRRTIEVESIDALVQIADVYDKVILHERIGTLHRYLVEDGNAYYRYETRSGRRSEDIAMVEPDEVIGADLIHRFVVPEDESPLAQVGEAQ